MKKLVILLVLVVFAENVIYRLGGGCRGDAQAEQTGKNAPAFSASSHDHVVFLKTRSFCFAILSGRRAQNPPAG